MNKVQMARARIVAVVTLKNFFIFIPSHVSDSINTLKLCVTDYFNIGDRQRKKGKVMLGRLVKAVFVLVGKPMRFLWIISIVCDCYVYIIVVYYPIAIQISTCIPVRVTN